jgi:NodT family efflux transporter outer membrane factor (OMF) lipoprotein
MTIRRQLSRWALPIVAALGSAAAAGAQRPHAPPHAAARGAPRAAPGERPILPPPAVLPPAASAVELWDALGDTALARLVDEALAANRDVAVARARVSGARAARLGAALELTPSVTAVGGYSRQQIASPSFPGASGRLPAQELWDAGLRASWEVDVFGRLRHTLRAQAERSSAVGEQGRDVRVQVAAQVADAYFALRGAQARLAVAGRNAENQRGTLEVTKQRLDAGRGTALDSERAQSQLSATLAALPALEGQIAAAQYRIGVLVGRAPAAVAPELAARAAPAALPEVPGEVRADSVVRLRPDVRSAEREVAAAAAVVGASRADYLPRVAIAATAGYTGNTFDALGRRGTPRYAVGPVVSWPALDVGRVRAGVDAARAEADEARARYDQTVLRSLEEVETSLVTYRTARARLRHLADAAAASERAADLARLRYTEGASDFLPVLDAERTMLERQDAQAQGQVEATTALVAVYRALGGTRAFSTAGRR